MTPEQKQQFKDLMKRKFKPHANGETDKYLDQLVENSILEAGGWEQLEKDVATGVKNGFSFEAQLAIVERFIDPGNIHGE